MRPVQFVHEITGFRITRIHQFHSGRLDAIAVDQLRVGGVITAHVEIAGRIGAVVMAAGRAAAKTENVGLDGGERGRSGAAPGGHNGFPFFFGASGQAQ